MKIKINKFLVVFLCLSFFVSTVKAQFSENISKQEFDKIIDFLSAEVSLNYFLSTNKNPNVEEKVNKLIQNNTQNNPLNLSDYELFLKDDSSTLRIHGFIQEMKNSSYSQESTSYNRLANLKPPLVFEKPPLKQIWDNALQKVYAHYNFDQSKSQPSPSKANQSRKLNYQDQNSTTTTAQNNRQYGSMPEKSNFWLYTITAILILISFFASILFSAKYTNSELRKFKLDVISKTKNTNQTKIDDREIRNLEQILNDKISQLEVNLKNLKSDYYSNKANQIRSLDSSRDQNQPSSPLKPLNPPAEKAKFYMAIPSSEGYFNNSQKRDYSVPGNSIYKFELINNYSAYFYLECDQIAMKDAIEIAYKYVDPVCESDNERFSSSSNIKTIEPGLASLEGDKWIVKHKAKIRYE